MLKSTLVALINIDEMPEKNNSDILLTSVFKTEQKLLFLIWYHTSKLYYHSKIYNNGRNLLAKHFVHFTKWLTQNMDTNNCFECKDLFFSVETHEPKVFK